ncbi:MAG: subclass B1 metallo-beta-lactamase [Kofleriaceae bacterium]
MRRRRFVVLVALGSLATACPPTRAPRPSAAETASDQPITLAEDLQVRQLDTGVWLHVSSKDVPMWGRVSSNGLIVIGREGSLLVDTPWTPNQTQRLLAWLRASQATSVRDVIVTHFHEDRVGGLSEVPPNARIHALATTAELAARQGNGFSATTLEPETSMQLVGETVETYFPGAGHAPDNIVVWLPARQLLIGGCFVRAARSGDLGNLADADVASWRVSMQRVVERYPSATGVIPGHGAPGGPELLAHTRDLVDAALAELRARSGSTSMRQR